LANDPRTSGYANGILALFERIPVQGPRQLGTPLYHYVDQEEEIYEFIKGPYRVYCFQHEGRVIVCSHLSRKTKQKTRKADIDRAIALRTRLVQAQDGGTLE